MTVDKIITGGRLVNHDGEFDGCIAIRDGKIVATGEKEAMPQADTTIDAKGKLVMPGVVDPHVHIEDMFAQDTYESASKAAALGGVTTFIDFAWQGWISEITPWETQSELPDLHEAITDKQEKGGTSLIDFSLHAAVTREDPASLDRLEEVIDRGVTSVKMFTTYDIGLSNGFMDSVFKRLGSLDGVAVLHTEDPSVCDSLTKQFKSEGKGDATWFPKSRPDYTEAMAAEDAVRMATEAACKYYGIHTTSRKAANVLEQFRGEYGSDLVRAETCTHYTSLDDSIFKDIGTLAMITPPIRKPDDNDAMFQHLDSGSLDVVSTDHNAYKKEDKVADNWWEVPFGAASIQQSLSVFFDQAVHSYDLSPSDVVRFTSRNPARLFGLPEKGTLTPGTDADIIIFDPEETFMISAEEDVSAADYSIYEGREVTGRVKQTLVRGELIADNGDIVGQPGYGKFIDRELPDWNF